MLRSLFFIIFLVEIPNIFTLTSPYYCANMSPQQHININQLMGMWYGIEIYQHNPDEEHYVRYEPSCPVIHISEDKSFYTTTYNPMYRDHEYRHNYGERRNDYNREQRINQDGQRSPHYRYGQNEQGSTIYHRRYGNADNYDWMRKPPNDTKYLRVYWDENGSNTEYRVKYKVDNVGFWQSSGPQNGSELDPQYSHFAGTIQVLKAVGNHLVLTFCHQLPERKLQTILLARENKLELADIHGVHNLLNRKGLSTANIKKVCAGGAIHHPDIKFWILIVSIILYNFFNSRRHC